MPTQEQILAAMDRAYNTAWNMAGEDPQWAAAQQAATTEAYTAIRQGVVDVFEQDGEGS